MGVDIFFIYSQTHLDSDPHPHIYFIRIGRIICEKIKSIDLPDTYVMVRSVTSIDTFLSFDKSTPSFVNVTFGNELPM